MNYDRAPLAAVALTTDSSALTAIGNDYGYVHVFARQVQALGRPGDVVPRHLHLRPLAQRAGGAERGAGAGHGDARLRRRRGRPDVALVRPLLRAPSAVTPIIQQIHIIAAHIVCSLVERALCPRAAA